MQKYISAYQQAHVAEGHFVFVPPFVSQYAKQTHWTNGCSSTTWSQYQESWNTIFSVWMKQWDCWPLKEIWTHILTSAHSTVLHTRAKETRALKMMLLQASENGNVREHIWMQTGLDCFSSLRTQIILHDPGGGPLHPPTRKRQRSHSCPCRCAAVWPAGHFS